MANIVRSGGGGGHEFIEIGAVASSYNGIDVKVNIVLKDDVWVTASTGGISFVFFSGERHWSVQDSKRLHSFICFLSE